MYLRNHHTSTPESVQNFWSADHGLKYKNSWPDISHFSNEYHNNTRNKVSIYGWHLLVHIKDWINIQYACQKYNIAAFHILLTYNNPQSLKIPSRRSEWSASIIIRGKIKLIVCRYLKKPGRSHMKNPWKLFVSEIWAFWKIAAKRESIDQWFRHGVLNGYNIHIPLDIINEHKHGRHT